MANKSINYMLPPLFPSDSSKLEIVTTKTDVATDSPSSPHSPSQSVASLHVGAWVVGTSILAVFSVVVFLAIGIVTSSPSTASTNTNLGKSNLDLGNVYGTWTDLPQHQADNQPEIFNASALQSQLAALIDQHHNHTFGIVVAPVGKGSQVRINDDHVFTGASTTKLLTAAAVLARVDSGELQLDQVAYEVASETEKSQGLDRYQQPKTSPTSTPSPSVKPTPVTVQQALQQMVNQSNNTAWEKLINLIGSKSLRQYAIDVGMQDYEVTHNLVSPRDLALLLQKVYTGQLLSQSSTQLLLSYMQGTNEERMIPAAITDSGEVYHKYGWLGSVVHDVGVIDNFGNPIIVVLMSEGDTSYTERTQIVRQLAEMVEQALLAGGK